MYNVFNQYKELLFDYEKIIADISKGIKHFEKIDNDININLILVNDEEITKINKQYRYIDAITDVISFEGDDEEDLSYLGDIFINIDRVIVQSQMYNHSVEREFAFLLCHGTLHLLGYDHLTKEEEIVMFTKQEDILNYLNYRR